MAFTKSNINEPNLSSSLQSKINDDFLQATVIDVDNQTIPLLTRATKPMTITGLYADTDSGTCDIRITIDGTPVTGLASVSVSSTRTSATATANNSVSVGQEVAVTITNNSSASMLGITLEVSYE